MDSASTEIKKTSDGRSEVSSNILLYSLFHRPIKLYIYFHFTGKDTSNETFQ